MKVHLQILELSSIANVTISDISKFYCRKAVKVHVFILKITAIQDSQITGLQGGFIACKSSSLNLEGCLDCKSLSETAFLVFEIRFPVS